MAAAFDHPNDARPQGISEDQKCNELRAQRRYFAAVAEMRAAIDDLNQSSVVVEIEPSAFECPTLEYWSEKLAAVGHE